MLRRHWSECQKGEREFIKECKIQSSKAYRHDDPGVDHNHRSMFSDDFLRRSTVPGNRHEPVADSIMKRTTAAVDIAILLVV